MRFRLATFLLVVAFVAAWLATLQAPAVLGRELRQPLRWLVFGVPVIATIYCNGRQRAFFAGAVVILALRLVLAQIQPPDPNEFKWMGRWLFTSVLGEEAVVGDGIFYGVVATIELFVTLTFSLIGGLIAIRFYNASLKLNSPLVSSGTGQRS